MAFDITIKQELLHVIGESLLCLVLVIWIFILAAFIVCELLWVGFMWENGKSLVTRKSLVSVEIQTFVDLKRFHQT